MSIAAPNPGKVGCPEYVLAHQRVPAAYQSPAVADATAGTAAGTSAAPTNVTNSTNFPRVIDRTSVVNFFGQANGSLRRCASPAKLIQSGTLSVQTESVR